MTEPVKVKKIRALVGKEKTPDGDLRPLLESSLKGLKANANVYSKPPIELTTYEAGIRAYESAIPAALDGSKTAVALKNKLKGAVVKMYTELAHYVEANCNDDMATFLLSGLQAAATTKTSPQPLEQLKIDSLVPGPVSGTMKLKTAGAKKSLSREVHFAPVPQGGGVPANWTTEPIPSKKPFIISNLTPGTQYMFQVRALGLLGYTNWSDPVNRYAI